MSINIIGSYRIRYKSNEKFVRGGFHVELVNSRDDSGKGVCARLINNYYGSRLVCDLP